MPCIQICGDFELRFNYLNYPYHFTVKQRGVGFTVKYGEQEYRNFAQVVIVSPLGRGNPKRATN